MKRILLMIWVCILLATISQAQNYFSRLYDYVGLNSDDAAHSIVKCSGGYMVNGGTYPENQNLARVGLLRIDHLGEPVLKRTYGNTTGMFYPGMPGSLITLPDSGYVSVGSFNRFDKDFGYLMRFNAGLDSLWTQFYGDSLTPGYTSTILRNGARTPDGGFILVGDTWLYGYQVRLVLIKTDSLGIRQWKREIGEPGVYFGAGIALSADGGYYIGTYHHNASYPVNPVVVKTDGQGNFLWQKNIGGIYEDGKAVVRAMPDSGCIAATVYAIDDIGTALKKIRVRRMKKNGQTLWQKDFAYYVNGRYLNEMIALSDGNFLATGYCYTYYTANFGEVAWMFKFSATGDSLWYREYAWEYHPDADWQRFYGVAEADDGGYAACGYMMYIPSPRGSDAWVMKVDSLGCESPSFCWVGVKEPQPEAGSETRNAQISIAPNPARENTLMSWKGEALKLEVYRTDGSKVYDTNLKPSQKEIRLNVNQWPTGLYLVRVVLKSGSVIAGKILKE